MKNALLLSLLLGFLNWNCQSQNSAMAVKTLSPAEFKAKMAEPDAVVLDVRTPAEITAGKVPNALEIDFNSPNFSTELDKLDKSKTYLVYCKVGGRSGKTCEMMSAKGFQKVFGLKGGYSDL